MAARSARSLWIGFFEQFLPSFLSGGFARNRHFSVLTSQNKANFLSRISTIFLQTSLSITKDRTGQFAIYISDIRSTLLGIIEMQRKSGRPPGSRLTQPQIPGWHNLDEEASIQGTHPATVMRRGRMGQGPKPVMFGRFPMFEDGGTEKFLADKKRRQEQAETQPVRRGRPKIAELTKRFPGDLRSPTDTPKPQRG
jgi:hypothetical protein